MEPSPHRDPPLPGEPRAGGRGWVAFLLVAALGLAVFGIGLGSIPLIEKDEPRYAVTAREMLESGDYLVPRMNGEIRLAKPPLFYWLVAGSFRVFGVNEFAARLPSALAGLGVLLGTLWIGRRMFPGTAIGLRAAVVLAASAQMLSVSRTAIPDMVLTLSEVAAIACFVGAYFGGGAPRRLLLGFWACAGLAAVAKGPVGILVPLLVVAVFLASRRELRFLLHGLAPGLLVFAAIALPWFLAVGARLGFAAGARRLEEETVNRFLHGGDHPQAFYYYLPVLLGGFLPWTVFGVGAGGARFLLEAPRRWKRESALRFLAIWAGVVVLFFSLSRGKLATYVTSAFPALALGFAIFWDRWSQEARSPGAAGALARYGPVGILSAAAVVAGIVLPGKVPEFRLAHLLAGAPLLLGIASCGALARRGRVERALGSVTAGTALSFLAAVFTLGGEFGALRSMRALSERTAPILRGDRTLIAFHAPFPGLVFYLDRRIPFLRRPAALEERLDAGGDLVVLAPRKDFGRLPQRIRDRLEVVGQGPWRRDAILIAVPSEVRRFPDEGCSPPPLPR